MCWNSLIIVLFNIFSKCERILESEKQISFFIVDIFFNFIFGYYCKKLDLGNDLFISSSIIIGIDIFVMMFLFKHINSGDGDLFCSIFFMIVSILSSSLIQYIPINLNIDFIEIRAVLYLIILIYVLKTLINIVNNYENKHLLDWSFVSAISKLFFDFIEILTLYSNIKLVISSKGIDIFIYFIIDIILQTIILFQNIKYGVN